MAAKYGRFFLLRLYHESGFPATPLSFGMAVRGGKIDCLEYLHRHAPELKKLPLTACDPCSVAAQGRLKCLQFPHENGYEWDNNTTIWAAGSDFACKYYH